MQHRLWQRITAVLLMSILARGSAQALQAPSCPTTCVDQGIVYTREKAPVAGTTGTPAAATPGLPTIDISVPKQVVDPGDSGQKVPTFSFSERFTAQRKPRVTVLAFHDENADARPPLYSTSIEAMLVTFLKRKSQFVVVERERVNDILEEWKRGRAGRTNVTPSEARELLESVDAIIMGSVTLLNAPNDVKLAGQPTGNSDAGFNSGQRVEIDIKALGRSDGRIIATAKSSGPVHCLRSIVERLGVALEEGFLRPYYGTLQFALSSPDNVRIFLTPILIDKARDDEKPPVERGESLVRGTGQDFVEPWTTNPTSYRIHNVLGGWYTMRLERPGYEPMGIVAGNEEFQVHELGGRAQVFYQKRDETSGAPKGNPVPLSEAPQNLAKFVVYVDSRETSVFDGDKLHLAPVKLGGSIAPLVRRQLVDRQFTHKPQRVVLIGKSGLDINRLERPAEYSDDQTCDLFVERSPSKISYGRTLVAADEKFDFDSFRGGDLIIENYQGEPVPAGQYQIAYWEPGYEVLEGIARVNQGDRDRSTQAALVRKTLPLDLSTMGPRLPYRMLLAGKDTGYEAEIPLNFTTLQKSLDLPVDNYTITANIPGLGKWNGRLALLPGTEVAPTYDAIKDEKRQREKEKADKEKAEKEKAEKAKNPRWAAPPEDEDAQIEAELQVPMPLKFIERHVFGDMEDPIRHSLRVKTRIAVGGRLSALGSTAQFDSDEYFLDPELATLLDCVFGRPCSGGAGPQPLTGTPTPSPVFTPISSEPGPPAGSAGETPGTRPPQPDFLTVKNPTILRELLTQRLASIDLLVLDDEDMRRLRENPDVAALLKRYVDAGGALFAFLAEAGDYSSILGGPLQLKEVDRNSRFEMASGDIGSLRFAVTKDPISLNSGRAVLQPEQALDGSWRVLAYAQGHKFPRVLERGDRAQGGYVAVWLDRPALFRSGDNRIPEVEAARAEVEGRVVRWARYLAARRYDETGEELRKTEQALAEPAQPIQTAEAGAATPPTESPRAVAQQSVAPPGQAAPGNAPADRLKRIEELKKQGLLTPEEYEKLRT